MIKQCAGPGCSATFTARLARAKYCSPRCAKRAQRAPGGVGGAMAPQPPPGWSSDLYVSCLAELEVAGRVKTWEGQAVLALAAAIDRSGWSESGAGLAHALRVLAEAVTRAVGPPLIGGNVVPIRGAAVGGRGDH